MCFICQQDELPAAERSAAEDNLRKQADRMLRASAEMDKSLLPIGTKVHVGITHLDQARNQPPNVIATVLEVSLV